MKTREGFVSNSSTSSFCIYGVEVESPDFSDPKLLSTLRELVALTGDEEVFSLEEDERAELLADDEKLIEWAEDEPYETMEVLVERGELEYHSGDGFSYLGLGPSGIGDDETGAQFKERVRKSIEDLGYQTKGIGWVQEAYYC